MAEEIKTPEMESMQPEEKAAFFDPQDILKNIILNWYWFFLSLIIFVGASLLYLRYTTPVYQAAAKFLIKGLETTVNAKNLQSLSGTISTFAGFDNEMEILRSRTMAETVVRDLGLSITYVTEGRVKKIELYKTEPISVEMDSAALDNLKEPINLVITRNGEKYEVTGVIDGKETKKVITTMPAVMNTRAGAIHFSHSGNGSMRDGQELEVSIKSPAMVAPIYSSRLSSGQLSKATSIMRLVQTDEIPQRAVDYLKHLCDVYNIQANEDKNVIGRRTEEFLASRLQKVEAELDNIEGRVQEFKEKNKMVELPESAGRSWGEMTGTEDQLTQLETQIALFNSISQFMEESSRDFQVLPSTTGLVDGAASDLIAQYNKLVIERAKLLRTASENSPVVQPITEQIIQLNKDIRRSFRQSRKTLEIQRDALLRQRYQFASEVAEVPKMERDMTEIGRMQSIQQGLYLMLLQKREENNISMAATANKGQLLDEPQPTGKISPNERMIILIGILLGLAVPSVLIFFSRLLRYKIEAHDDVVGLTKLPILADVAVASETAKTKADIVVHANKNNQMEEIFRAMRTNLQFLLKEGDKVVMFTSSTSGEGKTFNCANLAVSFALLDKKVIIVGLDIRKPRLAELFELKDKHHHGITPLLTKENPTWEQISSNILPSGINDNLDLLLAGPIPPNPAELVARPSLDHIFQELRKNYDYILIDTAPVGLVTDTLQIARVADATIYMCRADFTPKSSFQLINALADEKKLPNMAIVINGIDMSKKKYGYAYGYGRYGKYGRYGSYGKYGKYGRYGSYGSYGRYGTYGNYGHYANSNYGNKKDTSIKR